jgi:hypothetical protein
MYYSRIAVSILLTYGAASTALAEEHRQHGVHEHGGGQLNVAVEQNLLMIDLSMPAMNVVGFEHPANNNNESDQVRHAVVLLKDGEHLFAPSPAAKCSLVHADVASALLEEGDHNDHEHEHHEERKHETDHEEEAHAHDHADFDVSYEFNCAEPSQLNKLSLSLFELFPGTDHLDVQAILPTGQFGGSLNAENSVLKLK